MKSKGFSFVAMSIIAAFIIIAVSVGGYFMLVSKRPTPTSSKLPTPDQPTLTFYEKTDTREKPYVQITFDYSVANYFNIYRATNLAGPWEKISENYPQSAHAASDFDIPDNSNSLFYKITTADNTGNESNYSSISTVDIAQTINVATPNEQNLPQRFNFPPQNIKTLKSIIYRPSAQQDEIAQQIRIRNFAKGEDILIASSSQLIVTPDNKTLYYSQISSEKLSLFRYDLNTNLSSLLLSDALQSTIDQADIVYIDDKTIASLVTLTDPTSSNDPYEAESIQQLRIYNIQSQKGETIYETKSGNFSWIKLIAVYKDDFYFEQSAFESPNSLLRFNRTSHNLEDITQTLNFGATQILVSPNNQYLALSTITEQNNSYFNRLSFYDLKNRHLIHSQLKEIISGEFPRGLGGFRLISWTNDSSSIFIAVGDKSEFFPLDGHNKKDNYFIVNLDGSIHEQKQLKEIEPQIQIVQLIDEKTAIAAKKEQGIIEKDLFDQKISLVLFDLINLKTIGTILESVSPYSDVLQQSIIGIIE